MRQFFVISNNEHLQHSIARYFEFNHKLKVKSVSILERNQTETKLVYSLNCFRHIADQLEHSYNADTQIDYLRNSIAILDNCDKHFQDDNSIIGMLVTAFPEVLWAFTTTPNVQDFVQDKRYLHVIHPKRLFDDIIELANCKFTNLFDATELRKSMRTLLLSDEEKKNQPLPCRKSLAVALDDEEAYAYFNAYTAFRFGFRAHPILSDRLMAKILDRTSNEDSDTPQENSKIFNESPQLIFEDIYLNFPDRESGDHYSELVKREEFEKLAKANCRIFLTVGHHTNLDHWNSNLLHVRNLRAQGKYCKFLSKPISGIFDIWQASGMQQYLKKHKACMEGFAWPPVQHAVRPETTDTHSAPGKLLEISERLIQRAKSLLNVADSVPEAIYGAVLAIEAQELLGNKTPTTAFEALSLKHKFEVMAECMFYGVQYNFDVESRFKDIEADVKSIGRWFNRRVHRFSELNAEIKILGELLYIFRKYNHVDEEQNCLVRIRDLHRHLWFRRYRSWAWFFYPGRWYIEFLLSGLNRFIGMIIFWIVSLSFVFYYASPTNSSGFNKIMAGPAQAIITFFSIQPPFDFINTCQVTPIATQILILFTIILGFIHLGIFVSHLYSITSRK